MADLDTYDFRRGYTDDMEDPTAEEEARNAFYQGFITEYERLNLIRGFAVINYQSELVWLDRRVPTETLNRERIDRIRTEHLLGIGDGKTTKEHDDAITP